MLTFVALGMGRGEESFSLSGPGRRGMQEYSLESSLSDKLRSQPFRLVEGGYWALASPPVLR